MTKRKQTYPTEWAYEQACKALERAKLAHAMCIDQCNAFAFDLGRDEDARARVSMLVHMDRWLEQGKQLADVSDEALGMEVRRRQAAAYAAERDALHATDAESVRYAAEAAREQDQRSRALYAHHVANVRGQIETFIANRQPTADVDPETTNDAETDPDSGNGR